MLILTLQNRTNTRDSSCTASVLPNLQMLKYSDRCRSAGAGGLTVWRLQGFVGRTALDMGWHCQALGLGICLLLTEREGFPTRSNIGSVAATIHASKEKSRCVALFELNKRAYIQCELPPEEILDSPRGANDLHSWAVQDTRDKEPQKVQAIGFQSHFSLLCLI